MSGHIDVYKKKKNGKAGKSWLLNAIEEPNLCAILYAKLDQNAHCCLVVWVTLDLVAKIWSKSFRYFENVKLQRKRLKLADYPGDNIT